MDTENKENKGFIEKIADKAEETFDKAKDFSKKALLTTLLTIQSVANVSAAPNKDNQVQDDNNATPTEQVVTTNTDKTKKQDSVNLEELIADMNTPNKHNVYVQNDTTAYDGTLGYYSSNTNAITLTVVDTKNFSADQIELTEKLKNEYQSISTIAHENKHKEDAFYEVERTNENGEVKKEISSIYDIPMSREEAYKLRQTEEISANIVQLLELRALWLEAKTPEEKSKVENSSKNKFKYYFDAIKEGKIDPTSNNSEDFEKELAFIGKETYNMWMNEFAEMYKNSHSYTTLEHDNPSNPEAYNAIKDNMLTIAGYNFGQHFDVELYNKQFLDIDIDTEKVSHPKLSPEQEYSLSMQQILVRTMEKVSKKENIALDSKENIEKVFGLAYDVMNGNMKFSQDRKNFKKELIKKMILDKNSKEREEGYEDIIAYNQLQKEIWTVNGVNLLETNDDIVTDIRWVIENDEHTDDLYKAKDEIDNLSKKEIKELRENITNNQNTEETPVEYTSLENKEEVRVTATGIDKEEQQWATENTENHRYSKPYEAQVCDNSQPWIVQRLDLMKQNEQNQAQTDKSNTAENIAINNLNSELSNIKPTTVTKDDKEIAKDNLNKELSEIKVKPTKNNTNAMQIAMMASNSNTL